MKDRVAFIFFLTTVFVAISLFLVGVGFSQTTNRKTGKSNVNKPREKVSTGVKDTLKLCQGVPIPPGYVVVAYLTSSTCPHGMYIVKKQDSYSESLSISKRNAPADQKTSVPQPAAASSPLPQLEGTSRPRRVGTPQMRDDSSAGADDQTPLRAPPRLSGVTALGSPVAASSNPDSADSADSAPGPEEVDNGDVVRIDTNFVTVPVSVLDRHGRFIPDLKQEDFIVLEDGIEQPIAYFEPAEKPFTVALLLDTSPSTKFHLWQIKEAAIEFARQLRPQDRVLIVSFNDQVLLLTEVTNDLNLIDSVINVNANMGSATRLYDAVELVINERLNKIKGRKAIVLFTDGVDTASYMATYETNIREVEELDALIYPIQYDTTDYMHAMQGAGSVTIVSSGNSTFPGTVSTRVIQGTSANGGVPLPGTTKADYDRADRYLQGLADKTGGRLYRANDTAQLGQAFASIAEELRRQYSLGYYPQKAEGSERRQIKVRVKRPNLVVRARDSYLRSSQTPR